MSPQDIRFLVGCLVAAIAIWKLARLITRVERSTGRALIIAFCWLIGVMAYTLFHHPEWIDTHPKLVTGVMLGPMFGLVKTIYYERKWEDDPKESPSQVQPAAKTRT